MIYQVEKISRDVRTAIDMNAEDTRLLGERDTDTLDLDKLLVSKIEDGCRLVLLEAPLSKLDGGHTFANYPVKDGFNCKEVALPDDFLRLTAFRMSDWRQTVYGTIEVESPLYAIQSSKFAGLRGNSERPVCALTLRPTGKVLEVYGSRDPHATLERADYQPEPRINPRGCHVELPSECYKACVHRIAALVLLTYGDQQSTSHIEMSRALLGLAPNEQQTT